MRPTRMTMLTLAAVLLLGGFVRGAPPDSAELAARIDTLLNTRFQSERVQPAPRAEDAEFLRRVHLDLTGRIPRASEVHAFLSDPAPDKRRRLVERLLDEPRWAVHFGNIWRAELLPEAASDRQVGLLQPGFENYLIRQFRSGVKYDQLVRELITVPLPAEGSDPEPVLRDPTRPNPLAFLAAKDAKPENLASAVARSFLGIRLECAQCHDHPFAPWKQEQFWSQAAFFSGINKQGGSLFAPLTESMDRREAKMPTGDKKRAAEFLDGQSPQWTVAGSPRAVLAVWVTSPKNPYFARSAVNRLWAQFFGLGIVEPVDDFRDDNPPSHPELLDELARAFTASGFDLQFLVRAICQTEAYQRSSARTHSSQDEIKLPARMAVKSLTGEQLFDSLALATGHDDEQDNRGTRRQFLSRFMLVGSAGEPETSVQQALTLLNGRFIAWAADPNRCPTLIAAVQTPGLFTKDRIEILYVATLSRKPTTEESERLERYVQRAKPEREVERLADVFWMLLNSAEFRLNH